MKNVLSFLITTVIALNVHSQITFENGYYINETDQKVDCLIKNVDWANNPTEFEYKLTENAEVMLATIKTTKEFGIYDVCKYVKKTVEIDRSSEILDELSPVRNAILNEETLFLKTLVEGKANLYLYKDTRLTRFFYSNESDDIKQLIFKSYKASENKVGQNNRFRHQLWTDLKCPDFTERKIENLDYDRNDLVNFFIEYNECQNEKFTNFEKREKRDFFNLSIRPGLNRSSLANKTSKYGTDIDHGSKLGFRLGVEAESILPFNNDKWSIFAEPTYQYFKSETNFSGNFVANVGYTSIEIPVGLRHYFFLSETSKIFINAGYVFDFPINSSLTFNYVFNDVEIRSSLGNLLFGMGYQYNDKYSMELRYLTSRNFLTLPSDVSSDYRTLSLIFGYKVF